MRPETLLLFGAILAGSLPRQSPPVAGGQPQVSPDGRQVVFTSRRDGNGEIYLVDSDGGNLRRLTRTPVAEQEPSWSPDGSRIVFRRGLGDSSTIVTMVPGQNREDSTAAFGAQFPRISADGRLVYGIFQRPAPLIYTMTTQGREKREVGHGMQPSWSPDGRRLAFTAPGAEGMLRLFVSNADGSNPRQVSMAPGNHEYPSWSPDGKRLAYFTSTRGVHDARIRVVEVDGSGDVEITPHDRSFLDETPSWFPDGKRLAIQSDRDGTMRVYVIGLDGSEIARLTP